MTIFLVIIIGALAGYFYWKVFGCVSGSCIIGQNKYMSALVGALLGLLILTSSSCSGQTVDPVTGQSTQIQTSSVKEDINAQTFAAKINGENVVLLDVRTPQEFATGHIPNATNLNYNDPNFAQNVNALDKSKTYLVYCKSGVRSGNAANLMQSSGFNTIYTLQGGIMGWSEPLEK